MSSPREYQPVLCIDPSVTLLPTEGRRLREAGYLVLRVAPDQVRTLAPVPLAPPGLLLECALRAIKESGDANTMHRFGRAVATALLAARPDGEGEPS